MTVRIQMAIDEEGDFIHIKDAVRGQEYRCIYCDYPLVPALGMLRAHHFRHKNTEELHFCHLYSAFDGDRQVLLYEQKAKRSFRYKIDKFYNLNIKLPKMKVKMYEKMNAEQLCFSIIVGEKKVLSKSLNHTQDVRVNYDYSQVIKYDFESRANKLNYPIVEKVELFQGTKPTLFKQISGEFVDIRYKEVNLSEEIIIISPRKLNNLCLFTVKKKMNFNGIYLYHLVVPEITDSLIVWFEQNLSKKIIKNFKRLDLIEPNEFTYKNNKFVIASEYVQLKVTPFEYGQYLYYVDEQARKNKKLFNHEGVIQIPVEKNHTYSFKVYNDVSNEITLVRQNQIKSEGFMYDLLLNDRNIPCQSECIDVHDEIESVKAFEVFNHIHVPRFINKHKVRRGDIVHFPFIGTFYSVRQNDDSELIDFDKLLIDTTWLPASPDQYQKVLNSLKKSHHKYKVKLINKLKQNYNYLPNTILEVMKKGD